MPGVSEERWTRAQKGGMQVEGWKEGKNWKNGNKMLKGFCVGERLGEEGRREGPTDLV